MPATSAQKILLVLAKKPVPGAVKTRLARAIGEKQAAELYRRMAETVWKEAVRADVHAWLVFDPASEEAWMRAWLPHGRVYIAQPPGDLGARLQAAFRSAFQSGAVAVAVIGTDAPQVTAEDIREAFQLLHSGYEAVLGPSQDGGYWLLGLSQFQADLFEGIDWSTSRVLEQTLAKIGQHGFKVATLRSLPDVDDVSDLRTLGENWDHE